MFSKIIGQDQAKLAIQDWYTSEQQPLLIYGSSGFGKTLFAESLGARTIDTTQMRGDRMNTILKPIKEAEDGEILFFDEIHSLPGKVLEGLYKIIDKGTFYDAELCIDLPIPKVRFIFATNILAPLPEAFKNRCKFIELQNYSESELEQIVHIANPKLELDAIKPIIKASKGVPRTALSLAKSLKAGAITEKYDALDVEKVNSLLDSRFKINGSTGLSEKEFKIVQKVIERGKISSTAVANLIRMFTKRCEIIIYRTASSVRMVSSFITRCNTRLQSPRKLQNIHKKGDLMVAFLIFYVYTRVKTRVRVIFPAPRLFTYGTTRR